VIEKSRLDCWQLLPKDRPTFPELYEQIGYIIETNYANKDMNDMDSTDESYLSMQDDWKKEIQTIFEELKTKEQVK
jgi:hypothetical protein